MSPFPSRTISAYLDISVSTAQTSQVHALLATSRINVALKKLQIVGSARRVVTVTRLALHLSLIHRSARLVLFVDPRPAHLPQGTGQEATPAQQGDTAQ